MYQITSSVLGGREEVEAVLPAIDGESFVLRVRGPHPIGYLQLQTDDADVAASFYRAVATAATQLADVANAKLADGALRAEVAL